MAEGGNIGCPFLQACNGSQVGSGLDGDVSVSHVDDRELGGPVLLDLSEDGSPCMDSYPVEPLSCLEATQTWAGLFPSNIRDERSDISSCPDLDCKV